MRFSLAALFVASLFVGLVSCDQQSDSNAEQGPSPAAIPDFTKIDTEQVYAYNCADSLRFSVYTTRDSTWLFLEDTTLRALRVKSASGARYQGDGYLYWSKGKEAILQKPKGSFMTCNAISQEKSWVAARIRGIDFRALGQEPGWILELTQDKMVEYIGNYAEDTLYFDTPEPRIKSKDGRIVYTMKTGENRLEVEIAETECTDSIGGFKFPYTVTIGLNGNTNTGCGRYL